MANKYLLQWKEWQEDEYDKWFDKKVAVRNFTDEELEEFVQDKDLIKVDLIQTNV